MHILGNLLMIITKCSKRDPISLNGFPFLLRLIRHTFYGHLFPMDEEARHRLLAEFQDVAKTGQLENLIDDGISIKFPDGIRQAKIRTSNAQYIALDRGIETFTHGYAPEIGALIDSLVPSDGVLFDVGANWGYFTINMASRPFFRGKIHAFEPIAESFSDLTGLVAETKIEGMVYCHQIALSNIDGQAKMKIPNHFSGMATISPDRDGITVNLVKLDDLGLGKVDFIKIDVEGHEYQVIDGAREVINTYRPYIIFEDWYQSGPVKFDQLLSAEQALKELDYSLFLPCWIKPDGSFYYTLIGECESQKLILIPIDYKTERHKYEPYTNLLACHKSRVAEMIAALT
jgi:FkbM family methyltransferase